MNYKNQIQDYIALEMETLKKLDVDSIDLAMNLLMKAYENKKKIYIFGN